MSPLDLILVLHNHQPVGNLPEVFRQAFVEAYRPLVDLLERHSGVRCALHYTGPLLEWLEAEEPQFLSRLAALLAGGQIEILGGGLYEPILAVIPDADKIGQLEAMSSRVEALFGIRPAGAWLAERVWEPHLPRFFCEAGLGYTILDQEHFEKAGLAPHEVDGAWLTEDVGYVMSLLPASTHLRYLIPWRSVEEAMAYLHQQYEAGRQLLVFGDDGEKLGAWPGTYRLCYEDGWLERFFQALEDSAGWVRTTTPSDRLAAISDRRRVYVPSASYPEMEDWSLPPGIQQQVRQTRTRTQEAGGEARFVRLGHWRGFLSRYAEANLMHQRATGISRRAHALPPGSRREAALDHLWRGQCNCPYWHGVFGGIYLYHIRHATYSHLVEAEAIVDALGPDQVVASSSDYDADGALEWSLSSAEQAALVHAVGGHLFEWDLRTEPLNLLNTLAPYPEPDLEGATASGAGVRLRRGFVDHLITSQVSLEQVMGDAWPDVGGLEVATYRIEGEAEGASGTIRARHQGRVELPDRKLPVTVQKDYVVRAGRPELEVRYSVSDLRDMSTPLHLATELSLALPPGAHSLGEVSGPGGAHRLTGPVDMGEADEVRLSAGFERLAVKVRLEPAARVLSHPLLSHHRTELGEEQVYQGTRVVLVWSLPTGHDEDWAGEVILSWDR